VPLSAKAAHVIGASQSRDHTCHWPGCGKQVKPAMWGCKPHWFALPLHLRRALWDAYQVGQEETMQPSGAYMKAAQDIQDWIAAQRESPVSQAG
jgi:hypothetical protein